MEKYTYDSVWKDKLVTFNKNGKANTFTYDEIGNPINYRDSMVMSWENGRQLQSVTKGNVVTKFEYNADGMRTYKYGKDYDTYYYYDDANNLVALAANGTVAYFYYDSNGQVTSMSYEETLYFFIKNQQGDIEKIVDANGNVQVTYEYDAWGNVLSVDDNSYYTISNFNPFGYRSYIYDKETGLYYVSSRYYDPEIGRFLNSDDPMFLGANGNIASYNLFAYCENNPVNRIDVAGFAAINVIFAAVGAVVGWLLGDFVAKRLGYYSGWKYWAIRTGVVVGGAVIGWFAGSLLAKIIATYLKSNPAIVFKITNKLGATGFHSAMKFLGINPFLLSMDSSKFIAIARLFNTKVITISYDWAVQLYKKAKDLGFKITLDSPHNGYTWHIHISGNNGKLNNLHIQIVKKAWDYLAKLLR